MPVLERVCQSSIEGNKSGDADKEESYVTKVWESGGHLNLSRDLISRAATDCWDKATVPTDFGRGK